MDAVTFEDPGRQRHGTHRQPGGNVGPDGFGDGLPASRLPGFEGALRPAETPAQGEIDIAGIVGDVFEMDGDVMEDVAEDGPEELPLRML